MTEGIDVRHLAANGIDVAVAIAGEGPPVVLLHGFPHTWRVWSAVIPRLARDRQVVAPDLRGLGGSSRAVDGYDALTLSRDLEALLEALDLESAAVVGIDAEVRDAFVAAYSGRESLHCAFEHYRAMPASAAQIAELTASRRLTVTLTVGAQPVGDALRRQLAPLADDLRGELLADCGHIIPLDRPAELCALLDGFL